MDTVIENISKIESAAVAIMDDANMRKAVFAKEMEERTAAFDRQLEVETQKRISELRSKKEIEMKERLSEQQSISEKILKAMEQRYRDHHTQYVEELFEKMTKE